MSDIISNKLWKKISMIKIPPVWPKQPNSIKLKTSFLIANLLTSYCLFYKHLRLPRQQFEKFVQKNKGLKHTKGSSSSWVLSGTKYHRTISSYTVCFFNNWPRFISFTPIPPQYLLQVRDVLWSSLEKLTKM